MSDTGIKVLHVEEDGSVFVRRITSFDYETRRATYTEWKEIPAEEYLAVNRRLDLLLDKHFSIGYAKQGEMK